MAVATTLSYFETATITAAKSFIVQTHEACNIKKIINL
jgi:hypothetical protein